MLGKLWKYDFKATWLYLILSYVILVGYTIVVKLTGIEIGMPKTVESFTWLMRLLLYVGFIIVAIGVQLFTYVQIIRRFYKNMFSDEGYLTNTLPVKPWELLVSKVLIGAFWIALTSLVMALCLTVLGTALPQELRRLFSGLFWDVMRKVPLSTFIFTVILLILSPFQSVLTLYACICAGQLFSKMRILAAVLIYLGYKVVESVIGSLFSAILMRFTDEYGTIQLIYGLILSLAIIAGGYFVCHLVLTKHLNLE